MYRLISLLVIIISVGFIYPNYGQNSTRIHSFNASKNKKNKFKFKKHAHRLMVNASINGHNTFIVAGDKEFYIKSLDSNFNTVLDTVLISPINLDQINVIANSRYNDKIAFFYLKKSELSQKHKSIGAFLLDLEQKKLLNFNDMFMARNLLAIYPDDDSIYMSYISEEGDILIKNISGIEVNKEFKYQLSDDETLKDLKGESWNSTKVDQKKDTRITFFSYVRTNHLEKGVQLIDPREFIPLEHINSSRKYYHLDNKVYITKDSAQATQVIRIDLNNNSGTSMQLKSELQNYNGGIVKTASYIHENSLFQLHLNKKAWQLTVYDLQDGSEIKKYYFTKEQGAVIKNTKIKEKYLETDGVSFAEFNRILNKSGQKLTQAVLVVNEDNSGNLNVDIGLIKNVTYDQNNFYWMHQNMMWQMQQQMNQDFINNIPVPSFPGGGPQMTSNTAFQYSSSWVIYFTSVLDSNTLDHIPGAPKESSLVNFSSTIERVTDGLKMFQVYKQNDHYRLVYYDKLTKSFIIEEIKPAW